MAGSKAPPDLNVTPLFVRPAGATNVTADQPQEI